MKPIFKVACMADVTLMFKSGPNIKFFALIIKV